MDSLVSSLAAVLGSDRVLTAREDLTVYGFDGTAALKHAPRAVVFPRTAGEVAQVVKLARAERVPVVTRGSGTGLSGGSVPVEGAIVLCLVDMNRILELDERNLTLRAEAGVTTQKIFEAADERGLFYPPDPGSMKISTIGGNVAENSGGLRGLKYGVTRDYVMGLEVVLANGEICWLGSKCVKDVAGYNLRDLFIGSEGTLGIITQVLLKLVPKPAARATVLSTFATMDAAAATVSAIIAAKIVPCTMEFLDRRTIACVEAFAKVGLPLEAAAVLLIETDGHAVPTIEDIAQVEKLCRAHGAVDVKRAADAAEATRSGGGTNIFPGLKEAYEILQGINAKVKHVIVLSDGEAPTDGLAELVQDMRASRITVSCVGVQGADRNLLSMIADGGEGRLYMVEDLGALPKIFMKETQEAQKSQLVEDLVHVRVAKRVEAIEGINLEGAPPLHGYVTTKPKPTGEVILISDLGEPILARWRYGAGTSVAWTSDVKNRWSVDWLRWGSYPKFWAQVVRTSMRRKVYDSYDIYAKVADGRALVTVDAVDSGDKFVNELDTKLEVIDPATNKVAQALDMDQTAAGRYTADFRIQKYGSYLLKAVHKRNGRTVAESLGSVALSYPLEYLRSTPNPDPMKHAAQVSGGHDQAEPAKIFDPGKESVSYTQDLWPYVLLGVVGLFLLDLYAKRVRLFGYRTIKFS